MTISVRSQVAVTRSIDADLGSLLLLEELTLARQKISDLQAELRETQKLAAQINDLRAKLEAERRTGDPPDNVRSPKTLDNVRPKVRCFYLGISCSIETDWRCSHFGWQTCPQKLDPDFTYLRCPGYRQAQSEQVLYG